MVDIEGKLTVREKPEKEEHRAKVPEVVQQDNSLGLELHRTTLKFPL